MSMQRHLYKVSAPRSDMIFYPGKFWRTKDWESSTTRAREGYIEDTILYTGDFDEVSIHLFPRVRTVRVRAIDADGIHLRSLGLSCSMGRTAYIFVARSRRVEVESFYPTIFTFEACGFTRVRKGEFVSREPQKAISSETIPLPEALVRWNVEACYVEDLDDLIETLAGAGIYFDEQT